MSRCVVMCAHDSLSAPSWQTSHVTLSRDMCICLVCHDGADRESRAHITRLRESCAHDWVMLIERNPPPRGGFLFTRFPHQEPCVRKRTPLEGFVPGSSRGVLFLTHGSWWGTIVHRKPPRGGWVLSINCWESHTMWLEHMISLFCRTVSLL